MTPAEMEARIVRYGDLRPCKTALSMPPGFGSKNFTIIQAVYRKAPIPASSRDAGL